MPTSKHWHDPTRYALLQLFDGAQVPIDVAAGGAIVVDDAPDAEARVAELVEAGCPIVKSKDEVAELVRRSRREPKWEFVGDSRVKLWQDTWGQVWLRCHDKADVHGAVQFSKYLALGLGEELVALAQAAPTESAG